MLKIQLYLKGFTNFLIKLGSNWNLVLFIGDIPQQTKGGSMSSYFRTGVEAARELAFKEILTLEELKKQLAGRSDWSCFRFALSVLRTPSLLPHNVLNEAARIVRLYRDAKGGRADLVDAAKEPLEKAEHWLRAWGLVYTREAYRKAGQHSKVSQVELGRYYNAVLACESLLRRLEEQELKQG